ncbi:hypothetical protein AK830_g7076 [Neonectria ditissima]|uniref:HMG box domain-containing protein n=1 Tax=Neonectria ditissima TaxID=78410 RepID=A0A0P7B0J6_9HYPO|nr:hypothetical protein AK830_g7076 [Neonectria ditissima]
MLTSIGRAAARRITTTTPRLSSASSSQLLYQNVTCQTVALRAFSVSAWARLPASKATPKKTTKAAAPKAATTKITKKTVTTEVKPKAKTAKAKKPKAKKKVKAKKPKADGPKKRKLRTTKPLTPEEQDKYDIRELKKWSLLAKRPNLPATPWILYSSHNVQSGELDLGHRVREIAASFKNLSSREMETLEATAQANRLTNEANYKAWVESYPVERIYLANKARRRLARKLGQVVRVIRDDRLPSFPGHAYANFVKGRFHGTAGNASMLETMKVVGSEWKSLSDAEKQPYEDEIAADVARYKIEIKEIRAKADALVEEVKAEEAAKEAEMRAVRAAKAAKYRADKKAEAEAEAELESK